MSINTTIPISEARKRLPKLVELASDLSQKTFITVKGKVKAVLFSADELSSIEETLDVLSDKDEVRAIREGLDDIKHGRLVTWEKIKNDMDL